MKKTLAIAATSAALVIAGMAPAHAAEEPTLNIVELAVAASGGGAPDDNGADYDLLVQAVLYTQLDGVLATAPDITVFAPNDAAFLTLVEDVTGVVPASEADALATIVAAYSQDQIAEILTYHVTGGSIASTDLRRAQSLTMLNEGTVRTAGVVLRDETPAFKDPKLVRGGVDIHATNGVIHTIDRVLVPGTL